MDPNSGAYPKGIKPEEAWWTASDPQRAAVHLSMTGPGGGTGGVVPGYGG